MAKNTMKKANEEQAGSRRSADETSSNKQSKGGLLESGVEGDYDQETTKEREVDNEVKGLNNEPNDREGITIDQGEEQSPDQRDEKASVRQGRPGRQSMTRDQKRPSKAPTAKSKEKGSKRTGGRQPVVSKANQQKRSMESASAGMRRSGKTVSAKVVGAKSGQQGSRAEHGRRTTSNGPRAKSSASNSRAKMKAKAKSGR